MDLSKLTDAQLAAMAGEVAPSPFAGMDDAALAAIAGDPAPAKASAEPPAAATSLAQSYGRVSGLGYRAGVQGGVGGLLSLGTLPVDAMVNAAYGAKKLASKTGLVDAPDPKNYYGKSDSYLPTTTGVAEAVGEGLDAVGLPKPATASERLLSAAGEGVTGALSGTGVGGMLAKGGSALTKRIGGFLAAQPEVQAASGAASGVAAQGATELGADPTGATVAGILAGGATGLAGAKARQPARAAVPTTDELRAARTAAYDAKDAAGITTSANHAQGLGLSMRQSLPAEGVFPQHDTHAAGILASVDRLGAPDATGVRRPVALSEIEKVRQNAGELQKNLDPSVRRTGSVLTGQIDDFVDNIPGAGPLSDNARAANRRFAKASALDLALDKADLRAKSTGTGANGENTVRQNLRQIIQDPNSRAFRQFDAPEREAMRRIVEGSRTQNALRWGSRFAPTGTVSGILGLGAAASGYGAVPLAGLAAKGAGDYLHGRNVRRLEDLVKGGPGAGRRPSANATGNTARGAAQGFLAGSRFR